MSEIRSREVFDPKSGTTYRVQFAGVLLADGKDGPQVFLSGPVDLSRYWPIMFSGIREKDGVPWKRDGFGLKVSEVDGEVVDKFWNLVSRRGQERLLPFLESGELFKGLWELTPVGEDVDTTYTIRRIPPG